MSLLERVREVVSEANNSLFGSQGFFLSIGGGEIDKYHLARPIEDLKARANREYNRAERLRDALAPFAAIPIGPEITEDRDLVLMKNAGVAITVGDVLEARAAIARAEREGNDLTCDSRSKPEGPKPRATGGSVHESGGAEGNRT